MPDCVALLLIFDLFFLFVLVVLPVLYQFFYATLHSVCWALPATLFNFSTSFNLADCIDGWDISLHTWGSKFQDVPSENFERHF